MKEQWAAVKTWWSNLAMREKKAVVVGSALLMVFMVYEGVWSPLMEHVNALRQRIQTDRKTLVWMQAADQMLQKTGNRQQAKRPSTVVLLSDLQKEVNERGLGQALTRLEQSGEDGVEMQFQQVEFDKLMRFLVEIVKEQNVVIMQMSAVATATSGVGSVMVELRLK